MPAPPVPPSPPHEWQRWMDHAARLALRGHGNAEPNPMVGCVVLDAGGALAGEGYHRRCGGAHAEVEALRRAGARARGGTAIVTLEPCNHHGRTGPCSHALVAAGVARVVYACADTTRQARGGAAYLAEHGVHVVHAPTPSAELVTEPFLRRMRTGRPWVALKWAQTAGGALAHPGGQPRWISGPRSLAMVHRERGRVDAILTGMGTVLADDPLLTARGVTLRRRALRAVWAPRLGVPHDCRLVRTAREVPLVVGAPTSGLAERADECAALRAAGVHLQASDTVRSFVESLGSQHGAATVMVEAGTGLMTPLLREGLADEAWVFVAGARPDDAIALAVPLDAHGAQLVSSRMRGADLLLHYRLPGVA